jgi:DNA-binding response OmpR family regulator
MRVLIVEDGAELNGALERRLRASGFAVDTVTDIPDSWMGAGHDDILHREYETLPPFRA